MKCDIMIQKIKTAIETRHLRIVDEDSDIFEFDDDIVAINFTENTVKAGTVIELPAVLDTEWDNIRTMIITGKFEDVEAIDSSAMKLLKFTAEDIENFFIEDIEFTEEDEQALRENVASMVTKDLQKLDTIRLSYYENFTSNVKYQEQVFNNTFVEDCIDEIVDAILENDEAYLNKESAKGFIDTDIDYVATLFESVATDKLASDSERKKADNMFTVLAHYDLDEALRLTKDDGIEVTISNAEEVLEKTVKASGNTGRVYVPVGWVGREVKIVLLK